MVEKITRFNNCYSSIELLLHDISFWGRKKNLEMENRILNQIAKFELTHEDFILVTN